MNRQMANFLSNKEKKIESNECQGEIIKILENGFFERHDCIFLREVYPKNYLNISFEKEGVIKNYHDLSGFEVSTNRFHIEDYVEKDIFLQSFIFLREFKKLWRKEFKIQPCVASIGFQDDDVGKFATFTFHKKRISEEVFEIENIEEYSNPIYVEHF